jgi:hypothetical protein
MAKLSAATLLFVLVLPSAGRVLGLGVPPPGKTKKPSEPATQKVSPELEELGARALKNNPDIRVARERVRFAPARVRGREEELNRARLQVAKKVAALELEIRSEQGKLDRARECVKAMQNPKVCLSAHEYKMARLTVVKHEAKLAVLQAQRDYLEGKQLFPGKEVPDTKEPPEVAVAQARLQTAKSQAREAEAELNWARREVLNQVVVMHRALTAEQVELTEVQEQHVRNQDLLRKGAITEEEVRLSGFAIEANQARLATLRAELAHLLGEQPEQGKAMKSGKESKGNEQAPGKSKSPPEKTKKQPDPAAEKLSPELQGLVSRAFKRNPDIRVAQRKVEVIEAKVPECEAELNRVRLRVAKQIAVLEEEIRFQRAELEEARAGDRLPNLLKPNKGAVAISDIRPAGLRTIDLHKARLAALQAQRAFLQGKDGKGINEHPAIAAAQARLQAVKAQALEADAELKRTRLDVMNQIVVLDHAMAVQKAELMEAQEQHAKNEALFRRGCIAKQDLQLSALTVESFQAKLAALEAQLPYLYGEQPEPGKATKSGKESKGKPMPPK